MLDQYHKAFLYPGSEFSPMPFWFWNDELDKRELARQIEAFKEKGVDGFIIHPRIGLPQTLRYLSDEYMDYIKFAVHKAKTLGMKVILYDEAMYPSGSAHGAVVRANSEFASKGLRMTDKLELMSGEKLIATIDIDKVTGIRSEAQEEVPENAKRLYFIMTYSDGTIRGIYYGEDDGEEHAPKSADLLNPSAVTCFIRLTHDRYYECLKEYFGSTIIGMFTDEPMILGRNPKDGLIEWTDDFLSYYIASGGKVTDLPLLFDIDSCLLESESKQGNVLPQAINEGETTNIKEIVNEEEQNNIRKHYHAVVKELLGQSFYEPIAKWCDAHHIKLTGHPASSEDIGLLSYFDIPCQDIVWRFVEPASQKSITGGDSTMAKCSSDSARHHGKSRNGNECFGCCGSKDDPFLFTREDMKWYLDWLFVRGVNMIYPHAFFYSLREKRRDERPPDVGLNSSFWGEYHEITDYIKRMCELLTGSVNQTEVAILCTHDHLPWKSAKTLFEHQIEFNYLEEILLSSCSIKEEKLYIAAQSYHVILIEEETLYTEESKAFLKQFREKGGIILTGNIEGQLAWLGQNIHKDIEVIPASKDLRKTHIKKGNTEFIILTNEGEQDINAQLQSVKGRIIEKWDAETGNIEAFPEGMTEITIKLPRRRSEILVLG